MHASMLGPPSRPHIVVTGGSGFLGSSRFEEREEARRQARIATYDAIAEGRARWIERNRYYAEEVERLVHTLVPPGGRVLEIGCGLGDLLASMPTSRCVGVDVSPRMIELARMRHPALDLRVADVHRDPLPEGPFDFIVFSDAVGHFDDIEHAFEREPLGRIHLRVEIPERACDGQ